MKSNETTRVSVDGLPGDLVCPLCDGKSIETFQHSDTFNYGSGDSAATLQVDLPVRRCTSCEFEFIDHEGEQLRHEAVCRHLGVLTPTEVRGVRQRYGMTRAAFAQATSLGEATLSRWENGAVIQNRAYDCYMRLLCKPWIMSALQHLIVPEPESPKEARVAERQFCRLVVSKSVLLKQSSFQLRLAT